MLDFLCCYLTFCRYKNDVFMFLSFKNFRLLWSHQHTLVSFCVRLSPLSFSNEDQFIRKMTIIERRHIDASWMSWQVSAYLKLIMSSMPSSASLFSSPSVKSLRLRTLLLATWNTCVWCGWGERKQKMRRGNEEGIKECTLSIDASQMTACQSWKLLTVLFRWQLSSCRE